jgi:hypothetical protein
MANTAAVQSSRRLQAPQAHIGRRGQAPHGLVLRCAAGSVKRNLGRTIGRLVQSALQFKTIDSRPHSGQWIVISGQCPSGVWYAIHCLKWLDKTSCVQPGLKACELQLATNAHRPWIGSPIDSKAPILADHSFNQAHAPPRFR